MTINREATVDELIAAGRYADAAQAAASVGDHLRAAELYERIWAFAEAARCARRGGDQARALRNAIEGRDELLTAELETQLAGRGDEGRRQAMEIFADRRRFARAAALAETVGERELAADYYQSAHLDLDAARVLVQLGRDRDAGRLLERAIEASDPGPDRHRAHLELGLILARRMQHADAVRHLQEASRDAALRDRARRQLIVELSALGLRDAARDVLVQARADDETLPVDLDEVIRQERQPVRKGDRDRRQVIGGRYKLGRLLGSGGSGRVYEAEDEVGGRAVAIKLLSTSHARGDESYQRFVREARIASSLHHPNIVEVFDFSAELGYLVMELMSGGSLAGKLGAPLPGATVRRLTVDLLAALELAHQRGVIHRDVKPANIFFDARGTAKLGDFGVAHLQDLGQTQTGGLIGTLAYMSPEQITGAPLTIAADLYSTGVTLFEALTGRLPLKGPDFVAQHLGSAPPAPSEVADVDEAWDPVLLRLLAKSPDDRYASIEELRADITQLDLGERKKPLALPRASREIAASSSIRIPAQQRPEKTERAPRYQFETPLGTTSFSTLSRAVDTYLDRSVIIERFGEPLPEHRARRLFALARGGGPFVQRVLSYDKSTGVAVFEAPAGSPLAERDEALSRRDAVLLLRRLARAVAPLHEHGRAHGGITPATIVVDDRQNPTLMVSGIAPLETDPPPAADIAAIITSVASALEVNASPAATVDALVPGLRTRRRNRLLSMPRSCGEELYALADTLEIELLRQLEPAGKTSDRS